MLSKKGHPNGKFSEAQTLWAKRYTYFISLFFLQDHSKSNDLAIFIANIAQIILESKVDPII